LEAFRVQLPHIVSEHEAASWLVVNDQGLTIEPVSASLGPVSEKTCLRRNV
jgi:hypothetical protein